MDHHLIEHAYKLLKEDPELYQDALRDVWSCNTMVGAVMAFTTGRPRQHTELAVAEALARIQSEEAGGK